MDENIKLFLRIILTTIPTILLIGAGYDAWTFIIGGGMTETKFTSMIFLYSMKMNMFFVIAIGYTLYKIIKTEEKQVNHDTQLKSMNDIVHRIDDDVRYTSEQLGNIMSRNQPFGDMYSKSKSKSKSKEQLVN